MKKDYFTKELTYIKNDSIRNDAIILIEDLPDYFFLIPASSTGKYHPKYALGNGGLLRHTKAACRIALELLNDPCIGEKYTADEKDLMILALMLHDGVKSGFEKSEYTKFDHPLLAAEFVESHMDDINLTDEQIELVCECIKTHMGPWTKDYQGNEVLEKPHTKYQNFVHMCDYLASRKFLEVEFDSDNNILY